MNKTIVLGGVAAAAVLVAAGVGFYCYMLKTELSEYKKLGDLASMQQFSQENYDLTKENKTLQGSIDKIQKGFLNYRKNELLEAERRTERRVETAIASFTPISGPYVFTAIAALEQRELCAHTQQLVQLEAELFETSDPAVVMQQDKVCSVRLERKLIPLFKYQMLRVRAGMTGSLEHLRIDAEKKFVSARELLSKWQIPVEKELDSYTKF
ncbi:MULTISPECIES: hypothetical protein [unclassified Neptuniibacter]|jgi:hypothetical protein|uniref:hypothetical protein n=1 Tax=unclassified Neptuniibacter TaxID=2630693 RepID=UPI0026E395F8|nr:MULTISPECIES: hypothetical protein [unclassified Neptuniibacter]MDO6513475.1 hypothetical protein [Neptuniibacter sp. 2_MG-2023]MDO6594004.1 hypothetical protein [Neptuniibacter sp. 1_MG-2023]